MEKLNPCALLAGMENAGASVVNVGTVVPPNTKQQTTTPRVTTWSSNSTSRFILERSKSRDPNSYLYTVHSNIIHDSQKVEAALVSTNEGEINKMWYIHTTGYHPALTSFQNLPAQWSWYLTLESTVQIISHVRLVATPRNMQTQGCLHLTG